MTTSTATVTHRWLYALAIFAGVSFFFAIPDTPQLALMAWKGAAVGLLALWAALNARNRDGWLFTAVMGFGAIGDVLLELSETAGALAFLAGHLTAVVLYWRHRRTAPAPSQIALSALLLVVTPVIAFLLPADRAAAPGFAVYGLGLGAMAASAWISRFPRYKVGLGAVLFVASDLLIFARLGALAHSIAPPLLVWPLYVAGQTLIALGAVTTLAKWKRDDDLHHRL